MIIESWVSVVQVWQSSEDALLQMVVVVSVRLAAGDTRLPGWDSLGTGVQLLLVITHSMTSGIEIVRHDI